MKIKAPNFKKNVAEVMKRKKKARDQKKQSADGAKSGFRGSQVFIANEWHYRGLILNILLHYQELCKIYMCK